MVRNRRLLTLRGMSDVFSIFQPLFEKAKGKTGNRTTFMRLFDNAWTENPESHLPIAFTAILA